jgi:hypothetical protein
MAEVSSKSPKTEKQEGGWAAPTQGLKVSDIPSGVLNLNVEGRLVAGPLQGFGHLWQKTYRVHLDGVDVSPEEVVTFWKENLPHLMPADSRFYPSLTGVTPGEVVLINATLPVVRGSVPVSTGVLILYADETSFSVMTPEGHPEAGFNTFSAYDQEGTTVVQIQSLARAADLIYEFGFHYMGGAKQQERIWKYVLSHLAEHFGVVGDILIEKRCIDSHLQWRYAKNIWKNAMVRTVLYTPIQLVERLVGRRPS